MRGGGSGGSGDEEVGREAKGEAIGGGGGGRGWRIGGGKGD